MQKLYALTELSALLVPMPGACADSAGNAGQALYRGLRDDQREAEDMPETASTTRRTQH